MSCVVARHGVELRVHDVGGRKRLSVTADSVNTAVFITLTDAQRRDLCKALYAPAERHLEAVASLEALR